MVQSTLRSVLCVLLGASVGGVLGPLFVPDPTGVLAVALTLVITIVSSVFLYRSNWLHSR
jgi:hypothetical protein